MPMDQLAFAGIDLHKKYSYITVIDSSETIILQDKFKNNQFEIQKALLQLNIPIKAAVEATFNTTWLVNTLHAVNIFTVVAHPTNLRDTSGIKAKTDKIDSETIARFNKNNMLHLTYIPTGEEQYLKDIIRLRHGLVEQRTNLKNKVQMILLRNCIFEQPYSDIFGVGGQKWLRTLKLKDHEVLAITNYLDLINDFTKKISQYDLTIKELSQTNYKVKLLMSMPGIGPVIALTLVAEIGDINRFKNSKFLVSYAGLEPSTKSSGGKTNHGSVTKQGNPLIRFAVSEAVMHLLKKNSKLKAFYDLKSKEKGKSKARVACMRKVLTYVYIMLKNDFTYSKLDISAD